MALEKSPNIWNQIKKLNCPPKRPPLEIVKEDGTVTRNRKEVSDKWYQDISRLFNGIKENPDMAFDQKFYEEIVGIREQFEKMSEGDQEAFGCTNGSDQLNRRLDFQEVSEAIDQAKLRKAYLQIPNDVLKNHNAKVLLYKFLDLCFVTGLSPTDWSFSNIKPIPKPDKDPRDPLQNRCISIMCCVAKIFSWILNKRLQKHLESNNLLVDEQNGFRTARSCIDHLFVLVTVLRNRKEHKKIHLSFL